MGRPRSLARVHLREARPRGDAPSSIRDRVLLLDVNYTNNSRTLEPRGDEAAVKWSLKWMVWLQDLLLTWSFFV